jgi:hypothetical protein
MTPDKVFAVLSGIGVASVLFWWFAVMRWHATKPTYRVSPSHSPGPTIDESISLAIRVVGVALIGMPLFGTVHLSEYPPMVFIGFFLYTTVRFFSESRKHPEAIPPIS